MAFDPETAERIRSALCRTRGIMERKMFGGIAFMLHGNMLVGVLGTDLMVRVGPEAYERALARPHARPMDFTHRPMRGFVFVAPKGCATPAALRSWLRPALKFTSALPRK